MGLFSKSSSAAYETNVQNVTDQRVAGEGDGLVVGAGATVVGTPEATNRLFDLTGALIESSRITNLATIQSATTQGQRTVEALATQRQAETTGVSPETTRIILGAVFALSAALVGAAALFSGRVR